MPTTNPVPSTDPTDLLFNAGKLDEVVNGTANSFTDRLGVARRTVAGMNADFDAQLADAESDLNVYRADAAASAAEALGYLQTIRATSYGAYASDPATDPLGNPPTEGDEYWNTTAKLLKRWNGTTWQASDINTANLAASSGSSMVGYDGETVQDVLDDAKPMQSYTALRAYTGRATGVRITTPGIAGFFQRLSVGDVDYSAPDNGCIIIVDGAGRRWKRLFNGPALIEWLGVGAGDNISSAINGVIAAGGSIPKAIKLGPHNYLIDHTVSNWVNSIRIDGEPGNTVLTYAGNTGAVVFKLQNSAGTGSPLMQTGIRDVILDLNFTAGVTGLYCGYAVTNTNFDGLRIVNVAADGIGIDITKHYYATWGDVQVVNPQAQKGGTGVRLRGIQGDAASQVNAITLGKLQVKSFTDGVLIDSTYATHYTINVDAVIEQCTNAVRNTGTLSLYRGRFWLHLESNTNNVVWGSPSDIAVQSGLIEWGGYAASGDFKISHGAHLFRIWTQSALNVYMSNTARVEWLGSATDNYPGVYPGTSQPLIPFERLDATVGNNDSEQSYAITRQNYAKISTHYYSHTGGGTDNFTLTDFFRISSANFSSSVSAAIVTLFLARESDGSRRYWKGFAYYRNGTWSIFKDTGSADDATFTISASSLGVVTHTGTLDGNVFVNIIPM